MLAALAGSGALTAGEVAQKAGLARPTVSTTLSKLVESGEVEKAERGYRVPDASPATAPPTRSRRTPRARRAASTPPVSDLAGTTNGVPTVDGEVAASGTGTTPDAAQTQPPASPPRRRRRSTTARASAPVSADAPAASDQQADTLVPPETSAASGDTTPEPTKAPTRSAPRRRARRPAAATATSADSTPTASQDESPSTPTEETSPGLVAESE